MRIGFLRQSMGLQFPRILAALFAMSISTSFAPIAALADPDSLEENLAEYLALTREALTRDSVRAFLRDIFREEQVHFFDTIREAEGEAPRTRDVSETQFLLLLRENPELVPMLKQYMASVPRTVSETESDALTQRRETWAQKFKHALDKPGIKEKFGELGDPTVPLELNSPDSPNAYKDVKFYVNHPWKMNGVSQPVTNLKQLWIEQIRQASEVMMNVYEFDLDDIADELIAKCQEGKPVSVGIDLKVMDDKPGTKRIYEKLKGTCVDVVAVDAVRINHQKLLVTDWSNPLKAKVLMTSGNPTQSCIGPEGDLPNANPRPPESLPNANHAVTLTGQTLALLIHHELTKTLKEPYRLKGRQYPLGGTYKIHGAPFASAFQGPKKNPEVQTPHVLMAFAPNGAFNAVGKNVIGRIIRETSGPVLMAQFAFSSNWVEQALLARAKKEVKKTGVFDFKFVGETSFAMMDWSIPLKISGLALERTETSKRYYELTDSEWKKALGAAGLANLRRMIRTAPREYRATKVNVNGEDIVIVAKQHHKAFVTGKRGSVRYGSTGSFNISTGAEENQEVIAAFLDERVSEGLTGMIQTLHAAGRSSVYDEAQRRNRMGGIEDMVDVNSTEKSGVPRSSAPCDQNLRREQP
ncbi:MAG: hypothetical protein JNL01_14950 [Bdellovibrionales bacterium]|nr:hypothetical protein [Bdellovibrionales bacterium]